MATDFPFPANWARQPPSLDYQIPTEITSSVLQKEQRVTAYEEGQNTRRYTVVYSDRAEYGRIHKALTEGAAGDGTFWIPFPLEPVEITRDFQDGAPAFKDAWSGNQAFAGGPSWWQDSSVFKPAQVKAIPIPTPLGVPVPLDQVEKICRINRDNPADFEIRTATDYVGSPGSTSYILDADWINPFGAMHMQLFYLMDLVRLVSVTKKSYTDTQHDYVINWESVR
jgi:hypothetical protein